MSDQQAAQLAMQSTNQDIAPGAMAAATSGMNAPNVSNAQDMWNAIKTNAANMNPQQFQSALGMLRQGVQPHKVAPMLQMPMMAAQGQMPQHQTRQMPALLAVRPSRIF